MMRGLEDIWTTTQRIERRDDQTGLAFAELSFAENRGKRRLEWLGIVFATAYPAGAPIFWQPRDPWQFTNELVLRGQETGDEFVFATSSKGGLGAIGELCKAYGKLYRQKPGMLPVIELGHDHYAHKVYGKTYFPVLKLVGWVREPDAVEAHSEAEPPVAPPAQSPPSPSTPAKAPEPPAPKRTRF